VGKRRQKKTTLMPIITLVVGIAVFFILAQDWVGRSLLFLAIIGIPACIIAMKLYPSWAREKRFRGLKMDDVDNMAGHAFEQYVAALMKYRGFQAKVTTGSGDLGVDIVAEHNGVRYAVQCKRYSDNLSRTAISDAVAGKHHYGCAVAVVVTNRYFRSGAKELSKSTQCVLVDRDTLAEWVNDYHENKPIYKLL
jgi:HJR/Mrr/RecB family endonuclease